MYLFLATPWAGLRCVIVTFPGHTYLLFGLGNYIIISFRPVFLANIIDQTHKHFPRDFRLNVYSTFFCRGLYIRHFGSFVVSRRFHFRKVVEGIYFVCKIFKNNL